MLSQKNVIFLSARCYEDLLLKSVIFFISKRLLDIMLNIEDIGEVQALLNKQRLNMKKMDKLNFLIQTQVTYCL